ncbi:hypothetical protein [Streptomyces sp. B6B3]|uniref:hypothetical protein n=1 Tax=Streptomyces sp. B6B3 TaxID=3153570 RepID=UPI00325D77B7
MSTHPVQAPRHAGRPSTLTVPAPRRSPDLTPHRAAPGRAARRTRTPNRAVRLVQGQGLRRAPSRTARRAPRLPAAHGSRLTVAYLLGVALVTTLAAASAGVFEAVWDFLDWGAGVVALVCLTGAVLWGLAATDRLVLHPGHRLLAQAVHRGLAVCGIGFLALHVWVKIANERVTAGAAAVPFTDDTQPTLIGLGTLAAYLFLLTAAIGAVRGAFATRRRSRWWRALHTGAYVAWGASLVHGLRSGRAASGWVTVLYLTCLVGAAVALAVRIVVVAQRRSR